MIVETVDRDSGAILFKKDEESLQLEDCIKKIEELEKRIAKLEKLIK